MASPSSRAGLPRVLVTGTSGFTGRYLADALRRENYWVVGFGTGETPAQETMPCDLTDAIAVREAVARVQPEYVVHLAALSFVGHRDPEAFYRVNLFGTLNLLATLAALDVVPKKVIVASSANVYGANAREVIDEDVCPAPVNHYACSKLAMEHMAATWFDRLPLVLARPFNYTGVGQDEQFLIPKIVDHFRRGERVIELGNLDVSRDFSDVRDVVAAYRALLGSDAVSRTVNICSGQATALRDVIDMMSTLAGYEIEVKVNPAFVRSNEIPVLRGSRERIGQLTGWRPELSLHRTLQWMFEWNGS